jgi:hypothetical protein
MTTVAQLIEHLKTLPQDAAVRVGEEQTRSYANYMTYEDLDIESTDVLAPGIGGSPGFIKLMTAKG